MKNLLLLSLFISIFCGTHICNAQVTTVTPTYSATFYDKEPGAIDTTSLKEIAKQKNVKVSLSGCKDGCKMTDFSFTISAMNNNRPLYYEKIKGDKLSKEALQALKNAVPGNKIILSAFCVKCKQEGNDIVKEEFVYEVVE
jgi:hypothetical protein